MALPSGLFRSTLTPPIESSPFPHVRLTPAGQNPAIQPVSFPLPDMSLRTRLLQSMVHDHVRNEVAEHEPRISDAFSDPVEVPA